MIGTPLLLEWRGFLYANELHSSHAALFAEEEALQDGTDRHGRPRMSNSLKRRQR